MTGSNSDTGISLVTNVTEGRVATSEQGAKKGEACSTNIAGLYSSGDSSIEAAKANGQITVVATVDKQIKNILFVYGEICTLVTGR